ncbi:MAG TPA: serine protease [Polyangiaceae bacterium]|nr:serine protease [Polyangiaceae bacterium]
MHGQKQANLRCCFGALALLSGILGFGCNVFGLESSSNPESVCGSTYDLQDVELYDGSAGVSRSFVNRQRRAVGLLRWKNDLEKRYRENPGNVNGKGWCTGTLISNNMFLTAAHCLDGKGKNVPKEKGRVAIEPTALAREFVVEFRYEISASGAPITAQTLEVQSLEEYKLGELDYAILRLSDDASISNGVTGIAPRNAAAGNRIAILQHPNGSPMRVGAGRVARVDEHKISYDTIDTEGGSSGAGILDVVTGKLVGIHTNGGCTEHGDSANYGVPIEDLLRVSPILRAKIDYSKDFWVGDWNNDARDDLAVFHDDRLYADTNGDGVQDGYVTPERDAEEYFTGRWRVGAGTSLGWRRGGCLYLDVAPAQALCYGAATDPFDLLIADWDGDGRSDLGIQHGRCIDFDTDLDGRIDQSGYCFGNGLAEDQYLAGKWDGGTRDSIAVRRGAELFADMDRDGVADASRYFGNGGDDSQYLAGDWDGSGRTELAVRRQLNLEGSEPGSMIRSYQPFWKAP